jgi:Short C-terminal domain
MRHERDLEEAEMFRRRPLLRAAAVGGTAYVAGKHVARNQAEQAQTEADQDQRISDLEAQQGYQQPPPQQYQQPPPQYQQAPPPPPPPAAPPSSPMIDQLNQLATLHQQGVLSDDEFTAAKAKLFAT